MNLSSSVFKLVQVITPSWHSAYTLHELAEQNGMHMMNGTEMKRVYGSKMEARKKND
jgi:hypothetical protein